ncbi:MAG: oligoendopeptidase F [Chloroflexota bacterium]
MPENGYTMSDSAHPTQISRRDMLKGLGGGAVGIAVLPALTNLVAPIVSPSVATAQVQEPIETPTIVATPEPAAAPVPAQEAVALRKRSEIPLKYRWDLSTIYADDNLWEVDFQAVKDALPGLQAMEGHLGDSASGLLSFLKASDETLERLDKLYVYAAMRHDEDTTNSRYQALVDRAENLATDVSSALAFVEPEILAIPEEKLWGFLAAEPDLTIYRHSIEELLRQKAHVRSSEVEEVLALTGEMGYAPNAVFEMLNDADFKFPSIKDERGQTVPLSHARYQKFILSPDRRVRKDAFESVHATYYDFRNTLATCLSAKVRAHVINARIRGYPSALEAALSPNSIPVDVYHNLIRSVEDGLPSLQRYIGLRKRLLQLDEIHYYDLYVPVVPDVTMEIPYDEAARIVVEAMAPLGSEYQEVLRKGFSSRWIDVYETEGKRSGAYCWGAKGTTPFVLLNYENTLNDLFRLAHELGHALHFYFTSNNQPYVYSRHPTFTAEVASTTNEALLTEYLLDHYPERELRLYLINKYLENFRGTFFRQTMFAEFELEIHRRSEEGEALTPDLLSSIYKDLNVKYYGQGVVLDEAIAIEWARVPHFYYNFYVYQYATGMAAALALTNQILNEGKPAVDRYLRFLKSGDSDYPIELLKAAGVDMTTAKPIEQAIESFNRLLGQLEGKNHL